MDVRFIDPYDAVLIERGYGLDAIGALHGVKLARKHIETDHSYRARLIARLRNEIGADEFVFDVDTKPNQVRDAVLANQ